MTSRCADGCSNARELLQDIACSIGLAAGIGGAADLTLISVGGVKAALDRIIADYTK